SYGQASGKPPAQVQYRFRDAANCSTTLGLAAVTPNLSASARGAREAADRFLIQHAGALLQQAGGAALFRLGDTHTFWLGRRAVPARYLLPLAALPADLQIDGETLRPPIVAVTDGGGVVPVTGHVTRASKSPGRPCAFDPAYYHVLMEVRPGTTS